MRVLEGGSIPTAVLGGLATLVRVALLLVYLVLSCCTASCWCHHKTLFQHDIHIVRACTRSPYVQQYYFVCCSDKTGSRNLLPSGAGKLKLLPPSRAACRTPALRTAHRAFCSLLPNAESSPTMLSPFPVHAAFQTSNRSSTKR